MCQSYVNRTKGTSFHNSFQRGATKHFTWFLLLLRDIFKRYMYTRGRFRCARSATLEGLRGVTRNVTRFGKHNYMRPGLGRMPLRSHIRDRKKEKERNRGRERETEKGKRRTKILSPWKNITRCVMHERVYVSRRANRLWIDVIKEKSVQKSSDFKILPCSWYRLAWRARPEKRGRLSSRVEVFNFLQERKRGRKRVKSCYLDTFRMTESQFVITLLEVDRNFFFT